MTESGSEIDAAIRDRLALALDVDDLVAAIRLGRGLKDYFGVAKIGLELYSAAGPEAIGAIADLGYKIFLDIKLHDIPTTVGKAARVLGAFGVQYLTMHAHGGVDMLRAGVQGLEEGAHNAGLEPPQSLAITVLTSDGDAPPHIMPKRVMLAAEAGCSGIVCAVGDLEEAHHSPRLTRVTPGIRLSGDNADDQARAASPGDALAGGSDLLVVGRAVTRADDPLAAAQAIRVGSVGGLTGLPVRSRDGHPAAPHRRCPARSAGEGGRSARVRANLKQALKAGELGLADVLARAESDEVVAMTKILTILEALPGVGKVKSRRTMASIGISESRRVQGLGAKQRRALLTAFGDEVATSNDD